MLIPGHKPLYRSTFAKHWDSLTREQREDTLQKMEKNVREEAVGIAKG